MYDGLGQLNDKNGNIIYIGNYKENKKYGYGKLYDITFDKIKPKYNGEWCDDKFNGSGHYIIQNQIII